MSVDTKQRRAHKQGACELKLLYENYTTEYASGIGLDIGSEEVMESEKEKKPRAKRAKRTSCKCGTIDHLTS